MIYGASYGREPYGGIVAQPVAAAITDMSKERTVLTTHAEKNPVSLPTRGISTLRTAREDKTVLT